MRISDWSSDVCSSDLIRHAENVGRLFRPDDPLLPNYKYVPIGYHGRASSVQVSGAALKRPKGQIRTADADAPVLAPCKRLDYELEMGIDRKSTRLNSSH